MGNNCCKKREVKDLSLLTGRPNTRKTLTYSINERMGRLDDSMMQKAKNSNMNSNANSNSHSISDSNMTTAIISNNSTNGILKLPLKEREKLEMEKFKTDILNEFNSLRSNPCAYTSKVQSHMQYIFLKPNPDVRNVSIYYDNFNYPKINLLQGEPAFKNCIDILEQTQPMQPLTLVDEIAIKVPEQVSEMNDKNRIIELIRRKKNELNELNKYRHFGFHYDNGSIDAEVSTLLQVVDDNNSNGQRRANIINPHFKYLGVSVGKVKPGRHFVYLSFASD